MGAVQQLGEPLPRKYCRNKEGYWNYGVLIVKFFNIVLILTRIFFIKQSYNQLKVCSW